MENQETVMEKKFAKSVGTLYEMEHVLPLSAINTYHSPKMDRMTYC